MSRRTTPFLLAFIISAADPCARAAPVEAPKAAPPEVAPSFTFHVGLEPSPLPNLSFTSPLDLGAWQSNQSNTIIIAAGLQQSAEINSAVAPATVLHDIHPIPMDAAIQPGPQELFLHMSAPMREGLNATQTLSLDIGHAAQYASAGTVRQIAGAMFDATREKPLAYIDVSPSPLHVFSAGSAQRAVAERVWNALSEIRQPAPDAETEFRMKEAAVAKFMTFIGEGKPIRFTFPAFPAKSPNSATKVLGVYPDLGEELALARLNGFLRNIQEAYSSGGEIYVLSDGRIFADAVGVSDGHVEEYLAHLRKINPSASIRFLTIDDFYPGLSPVDVRSEFLKDYAPSAEDIRAGIQSDPERLKLYNAFQKFRKEDRLPVPGVSKTQLEKLVKAEAVEMMRRNDASAALISDKLSSYVRLSIHPQSKSPDKIGINILPIPGAYTGTPWHGTAVLLKDGSLVMMKKREAAEKGYHLIYQDGRPHHYVEQAESIPREKVLPAILDAIGRLRRKPADAALEERVEDALRDKIAPFITEGQPIQLALAGFSMKSPNPANVLGPLPDLAEELALGNLDRMIRGIEAAYPPGVDLVIMSEGRMWQTLFGASEAHQRAYQQELRSLPRNHAIRWQSFDDIFTGIPHDKQMEYFQSQFVDKAAREAGTAGWEGLFKHFRQLLEGDFPRAPERSAAEYAASMDKMAYDMTNRSIAYQRLVLSRFAKRVLLWPQPQGPDVDKVGIFLISPEDGGRNPWQGVIAVSKAGKARLLYRHETEGQGYVLVFRNNGQPYYYVEP